MGSLSIWHWIMVIAVVLLLFGRGKISELMGDMAQGIKAFKKGMTEDEAAKTEPPPGRAGKTIDHQASRQPPRRGDRAAASRRPRSGSKAAPSDDGRAAVRLRLEEGASAVSGPSRPLELKAPCSTSAGASSSSSAWSR